MKKGLKRIKMTVSAQRVNYDLIAHLYDEPGRNYDADTNLINFLQQTSSSQVRILDMGCGTGKQLAANYKIFPELQTIGLDLFHGMLLQAQKRSNEIIWIQGDNTNLPFRNDSFDYVTNQFSYHHVQNKLRFIAEAYRILKSGGRFVITNLDPWSMADWTVYKYFPASWERDLSDFLPVDKLIFHLEKAGLNNIQVKRDYKRTEENLSVFLGYASQRHRTSQLITIQDHEYEAGLGRLKEQVVKFGREFQVSSEICLVRVIGDKL
jgi:ubiquinone/menaquinone biosynthesis C-methylase UbiE